MISQTAEYALRAVVLLAGRDEPCTIAEISTTGGMPAGYLAKVMQQLARAKLVSSQRGVRGGFVVARPPAEITVLDVVNAVDPIRKYDECPLGLGEHQTSLCPLHRRLDAAVAQVEQAFRDTTLADLLAESDSTDPHCQFPHSPSA